MSDVRKSVPAKVIASLLILVSVFSLCWQGMAVLRGIDYVLTDSWQDTWEFKELIREREDQLAEWFAARAALEDPGLAYLDQVRYETDAERIGVAMAQDQTCLLYTSTMINTSAKGGSLKRINVVYNRNRGPSDLPEAQRVENGMTALKQEVSRLTGIYPDFYVMVEWEAIGELVDALGGVYFDVPFDMNYDDPYQDLHIHQEAGYRKLSGEDAMEVIRWRKNNGEPSPGDVGRIQIQQDFLSAVLDKCLQPATLLKAPALAQVFLNNVTTDLTVGNILAFAQLAIGMDPESDVKFSTMPYTGVMYDRASLVLPVEKELLEILNSGMNPYVDQIQSSDLQLMYKKSGGGYGVTTGTLLDSSMAYAGSSSSSSGTQTTQETEEPETEQPGETDAGTETPGTTPPEGTETGTGEPGSTGSETGEPGTQGPEGETPDMDDPGAVQPEGPGQGEGTGASQPEQDPGGGNGGASQSEPSQPGTEGESGGSDLPPEWLLPDVA